MDKGYSYLLVEGRGYKVEQGEILFFNRNQNHIVWSDSETAPHFLTISFDLEFEDDAFFEFRKFRITPEIKRIIKKIVDTRTQFFEGQLDSNITKLKEDAGKCALQLLGLYCEELMLTLYISGEAISKGDYIPIVNEEYNDQVFKKCVEYIDKNVDIKITLDMLSKNVFASKSFLAKLFRNKTGKAFSEYLLYYKLDKAYHHLSGGDMKVTEAANAFGFSSIHYFSRAFKKAFGFPPSSLLQSKPDVE